MAVTITVDELLPYIRRRATATNRERIGRRLKTATAMVEKYAPDAPEDVQNEAAARVVDYLDEVGPDEGISRAMAYSGARSMLAPWAKRSAGVI